MNIETLKATYANAIYITLSLLKLRFLVNIIVQNNCSKFADWKE